MRTYSLKLTRAVVIGGKIVPAGTIVEVDEQLAKNLLHRGRAELATEADAQAAEPAPEHQADEKPKRGRRARAERQDDEQPITVEHDEHA